MKYDVFISYSSHDQKVVEGLCAYLESLKIRCFVAYRDIPKSVVWAKAIVEALEQSRMMVVVFSNHFNNSVQVDREIELASEDNKPILTFRITNDAFKGAKKFYLKNINWIDAFPNPAACFGNLADNIAKLLGIKLIAPQPQTPAPTTSPAAFTPTPAVKPSTVKRALELLKKSVLSILVIIGVAVVAGVIIDKMLSAKSHHNLGETSAPYKVGDYYNENGKEGVVFEVSADGKHGKIISMTEPAAGFRWSSDQTEQGANSETDGAYNSAKVKAISGWERKYPAFRWCAYLGGGWYLPSKEELFTIYINRDKLNPKLTDKLSEGWYWSSTEYNEFCAWLVDMIDGYTGNGNKGYYYSVRAVSAFGDSSNAVSVATTSAPYKVGDYYNENGKEGVVFEVSADGKHGKIVSLKQAEWLEWSSDSAEQKRLIGADSKTDGAYNMAVVKAIPGWETKYPAFKWCADLGEGWYLPSKEELRTIYKNKYKLNPKLTDELLYIYWSSTEADYKYLSGEFCAWSVNLGGGYNFYNRKYYSNYVRAVSSFGDSSKTESAATTVSNRKTSALYKVGDYYNENGKEGVVFEVSADGRSGKIVSMKQSSEELRWSSDSAEQKRLIGADSETDGAYNTAKVKAISGWETKYPAFKWCADLGEGWYLPSKEELRTIYKNKDKLNPKLTDELLYIYWSSTEKDCQGSSGEFCAWRVYMGSGSTYSYYKSTYYSVRAVSAF